MLDILITLKYYSGGEGGEIWELRPIRNRILFFAYDGSQFILLSHYIKKTQKTPIGEIEKAKSLMNDYIERNFKNEKK